MKKIFNLSLLLDEKGLNRIDLASYNTLEELDDFIMSNFVTTEDVRKKYKDAIDIFLQKNKEFLSKIKRKYRGTVVITFEDGNKVRKIPVMYKDSREMKSLEECLDIFEKSYTDKTIIKKIVDGKSSILTGEELDELNYARYYLYYTKWGSDDKKAFDSFTKMFYKRITRSNDLYYQFRYMMDYFDFGIGSNKTRVQITGVESDKLSPIERSQIYHKLYHTTEIVKYSEIKTPEREGVEVLDSAPEEFKYVFYKALDTGDFDTLYNMYSIEEIEKYTNLIKGKRK